ncbi:MAG TPA: hypothetical protein VLU43_16785 [Anaeromyxobacteraceae bacterium]|nr:hypothetical protein [Anaeromyxobacteraceae bacterium]
MLRYLFAAAIAFALVGTSPAFACPNCENCPHKVAAADDQKPADKKPGCGCASAKDCKCGKDCKCPNCHEHGKKEEKKS